MKMKKLALAAALSLALGTPLTTSAESNSSTGTGVSATARLDFEVVIPSFVFFQVGSAGTNNVDTVNFTLDAANPPGSDTDETSGAIGVVLRSNAASVSLTATAGTLQVNPATTIPWTEVTQQNDASGTGNITIPQIGGGAVNIVSGGSVINLDDAWSYVYDNAAVYPAGTYTATVTYTAAIP